MLQAKISTLEAYLARYEFTLFNNIKESKKKLFLSDSGKIHETGLLMSNYQIILASEFMEVAK